MTTALTRIKPGDVICTRNSKGATARLIRFGAAFLDRPNTVNHVIIAHHIDDHGTFWGIEGRPGGVGWIDLRRATGKNRPYTTANTEQPKTPAQRLAVVEASEGLLGTAYDWFGVALAAMNSIGVETIWDHFGADGPPTHVVCSAFADYVYDYVGLDSPGEKMGRTVTPGDWARFIIERGWL